MGRKDHPLRHIKQGVVHATQRERAIARMDVCIESVLPATRNRLATASVQSGNEDIADSPAQRPRQALEPPLFRRVQRTFVDLRIAQHPREPDVEMGEIK